MFPWCRNILSICIFLSCNDIMCAMTITIDIKQSIVFFPVPNPMTVDKESDQSAVKDSKSPKSHQLPPLLASGEWLSISPMSPLIGMERCSSLYLLCYLILFSEWWAKPFSLFVSTYWTSEWHLNVLRSLLTTSTCSAFSPLLPSPSPSGPPPPGPLRLLHLFQLSGVRGGAKRSIARARRHRCASSMKNKESPCFVPQLGLRRWIWMSKTRQLPRVFVR